LATEADFRFSLGVTATPRESRRPRDGSVVGEPSDDFSGDGEFYEWQGLVPPGREGGFEMTSSEQTGRTALVTGASKGFGRAIASALHAEGAKVVAVARNAELLASLSAELGGALTTVVADVTDPVVAGMLIERHRPDTLVLNAGAAPLCRPLQHQTWETFSRPWDVDVRHAFHWIREALLFPLEPGSTVITMSSGAAVAGSPLSGGYAGAKAAIRFITSYAAEESQRAALGIRFVSVLPRLTPATDLGSAAVAAYAARDGVSVDEHLERLGAGLTVADVGRAIVDVVASPEDGPGAYLLTPAGLSRLG
jgi:NAD(P)-dependent dehydrogenase (short-subunit alcohol dehydrogenase family)